MDTSDGKCGEPLTPTEHPVGTDGCLPCACVTVGERIGPAVHVAVRLIVMAVIGLVLWRVRSTFSQIYRDMEIGELPQLTRFIFRNDVVVLLSIFLVAKEFSRWWAINLVINAVALAVFIIALFLPLITIQMSLSAP